MDARIAGTEIFSTNSRRAAVFLAKRGKIRSSDARSQERREISGNRGMKRKRGTGKNRSFGRYGQKGRDLCEVGKGEASRTEVAAPEASVARGGICAAADERGVIQSKWRWVNEVLKP